MPELENRRWELFAHAYAAGSPLAAAYEEAGFKPGPYSRFNASKLSYKPAVRARIAELQERAAERAIVGVGWIQHQLIDIVRGKEPAKIRTDSKGERIEEVDRLAALVALMRTLGVGGDGVTVNATAIAGAAGFADLFGRLNADDQRELVGGLQRLQHATEIETSAKDVTPAGAAPADDWAGFPDRI
jgi:hypothetical protein